MNNTGEKLIKLADIIFIIGIVISFFISSATAYFIGDLYNDGTFVAVTLLIVLPLGIAVSWLLSIFIRGFGQLISDNTAMRSDLEQFKIASMYFFKVTKSNEENI